MTSTTRRELLSAATAAGGLLAFKDLPAIDVAEKPPRLKVGQIGVGHAHATKLEVYRKSPDYEVVGVVEPSAELRSRGEKVPAYRGVNWLSEAQLLATPGLQVVLVETPVRELLATAQRCIEAG